MGLTHYCLIFYGLTLIYLTGPLSQVIQIMCVMWYIWIYLFVYIHKCKMGFFILGLKRARTVRTLQSTHTDWILGVERKELIELGFSHHHALSISLDTSEVRKWLSMALIKVSILLIITLVYALMSTYDPMWFKVFINWYQSHIWVTFKLHI